MSALAVVVLAVAGTAGPAAADTSISSAGPLTNITITPDLNCAVNHVSDLAGEWYGNTACGTLVSAGGVLYGPADIPAGDSATSVAGYTPFTPVSQGAVTGTGTAADPFTIVTVVDLGTSGLRLTETDAYVIGQETYRTDVELTNTGGAQATGIVYRAGDCFLQDSDLGLGSVSGSAISCKAEPSADEPNRIEQFFPLTSGSSYYEGLYYDLWAKIGEQQPFANTCACDIVLDNGIGLSWPLAVPAGGSRTFSSRTVFSPLGAEPLTVTKAADAPSVAANAANGYTITVTNPGMVPASLSVISDDLPAGFTYTPGSSTGATTTDPTVEGSTLTWNGPFSVPAASNGTPGALTLHFGVTVSGTAGTYTNSADASGDGLTVIGATDAAPITVTGGPPTTDPPTTDPPTTDPPTTDPPTTDPPTTDPPTTDPPTTDPPTTGPPTTDPPTTPPPATVPPTKEPPATTTPPPKEPPVSELPTTTAPPSPTTSTPTGVLPRTGASVDRMASIATLLLVTGGLAGGLAWMTGRRRPDRSS